MAGGAAVGRPPDVFGVEHIRDPISDQMRAVSPVALPGASLRQSCGPPSYSLRGHALP